MKFKVGDKVRCIEDIEVYGTNMHGREFVVLVKIYQDSEPTYYKCQLFGMGGVVYFRANELELVASSSESVAEKVGRLTEEYAVAKAVYDEAYKALQTAREEKRAADSDAVKNFPVGTILSLDHGSKETIVVKSPDPIRWKTIGQDGFYTDHDIINTGYTVVREGKG